MDEAFIRAKMDKTGSHELLHAVSAKLVSADDLTDIKTYGFVVVGEDGNVAHGSILDEATVEQYRKNRLGNDATFTYGPAVLAMDIADAIDPGLEKARLRALVLHESRGEVVGRLENIFGPTELETIEHLTHLYNIGLCDLGEVEEDLADLVAPEHKDLVHAIFAKNRENLEADAV